MMEGYKYTKNRRSVLSKGQRDFYEKNGYIVIPHLIDHDLLDECKKRFLDICEGKVGRGGMTVMKDASLMNRDVKGEFLINKIQDFLFDEVLFKYVSEPSMVDVVESIIGSDVTGVHSMLINKPPDAARETSLHPLHQDLHYFPFRPAEDIVAAWTAMETINEQNGCLYVIPGSHKGSLEKHDYARDCKNKMYHGVFGYDHVPKVNLVMEKGDTVFFHPVLLHGSGPNLTQGFRKAISCHYANSNCYFINVRGTTQENIAKEVEEIAARKGMSLKFEDAWRYKSRVVRGSIGNFALPSNL